MVHSKGVARVAAEAARLVTAAGVPVDVRLVEVAALLHDIDKLETRQGGGVHGQVAAERLAAMGFEELTAPVASHPVTCLLDDRCFPRGWPSVIVSVADRHVAQAFMTIDERIDDMKRAPPGVRHRPRRGAAAGPCPGSGAGRGSRPRARGPGRPAPRRVAGWRMSVPLLLAHGDDGFGLDQVVAGFANAIGADDRVEIMPERSPDEARHRSRPLGVWQRRHVRHAAGRAASAAACGGTLDRGHRTADGAGAGAARRRRPGAGRRPLHA